MDEDHLVVSLCSGCSRETMIERNAISYETFIEQADVTGMNE